MGDAVYGAVVEWEHLVLLRGFEPTVDEIGEAEGFGIGKIAGLGWVVARVEECPGVGREVVTAGDLFALSGGELVDVIRHRLPAFVVHRAAAPTFVVLRGVYFGRGRVGDDRSETRAVVAHLLDAVQHLGQFDPAQLEHRREHVGGVAVLLANAAARRRRRDPRG